MRFEKITTDDATLIVDNKEKTVKIEGFISIETLLHEMKGKKHYKVITPIRDILNKTITFNKPIVTEVPKKKEGYWTTTST